MVLHSLSICVVFGAAMFRSPSDNLANNQPLLRRPNSFNPGKMCSSEAAPFLKGCLLSLKKTKIALLKNFERFTGKHLPSGLQVYYKETPTQVFSCDYCKIFQNSYFEEHMQTTTSDSYKASVNCWFLLIQYSKIFAKVFKQCVCKVFRKNVHQWWVSGRNKL